VGSPASSLFVEVNTIHSGYGREADVSVVARTVVRDFEQFSRKLRA
jgi:hypothetical protein